MSVTLLNALWASASGGYLTGRVRGILRISDDIKPPKMERTNRIVSLGNEKNDDTEEIKVVEEKDKETVIPVEDNDTSDEKIKSDLEKEEKKNDIVDIDFFEKPVKKNGERKNMNDQDPIEKTSWLGVLLFVVLILVAIGALLYFSVPTFKNFVTDRISYTNSSSSSSSRSSTSYSLSSSSSVSASSESSSSVSSSSAAITAMTIKLLNGSGVTGAANTVKTALVAKGYTIGYIGNANSFSYSTSAIYYDTGKKAKADEIKLALPNLTFNLHENSTVAGDYDVVVVVGKK